MLLANQKTMNEIARIRDLDDEIFKEFQNYFPKILTSLFIKQFPKTSYLIQMHDISSNFIKNSIFDSCESDDYYGAKILFRSHIEHFIRFLFIFTKWLETKTDVFAKEYIELCDAREVIDALKAVVSEQKLFDPMFKIDDWEKLLRDHPDFYNKSRKTVEEETKKYSFKQIIYYLNNLNGTESYNFNRLYGKLIVEYSNLSSFVHGGTGAFREINLMGSEDKRLIEYNRICQLTFQIAASLKLFGLLMYVQTDKEEFNEHYLRVDMMLKRV